MPIDEGEMRMRLEETAAGASAPRLSAPELIARVRAIRRKRRTRAIAVTAVMAPTVTAAVAIPLLTGGGSGRPAAIARPYTPPPGPSYTVTVNGHVQKLPARGSSGPAMYYITPREKIAMTVDVNVPAHPAVNGLWLGITNGVLAPRENGPAGMNPVLVAINRGRLHPGTHRFVLHWTAPARFGAGASRELAVEWRQSGASTGAQFLASFEAPPGPAFSAATVRGLRAAILNDARSCGDPRPASIMAVRTTLAKATAATGGGPVPVNAGQIVYLVVMKGDFSGVGERVSACDATHGHYFFKAFDASTLMWIFEALRDKPPLSVPLHALGPVKNLK